MLLWDLVHAKIYKFETRKQTILHILSLALHLAVWTGHNSLTSQVNTMLSCECCYDVLHTMIDWTGNSLLVMLFNSDASIVDLALPIHHKLFLFLRRRRRRGEPNYLLLKVHKFFIVLYTHMQQHFHWWCLRYQCFSCYHFYSTSEYHPLEGLILLGHKNGFKWTIIPPLLMVRLCWNGHIASSLGLSRIASAYLNIKQQRCA